MTKKELYAKDLMCGDWVLATIEGEKFKGVVTKVDSETEDIRISFLGSPADWEEGDNFDSIEPILLTASILSKNGFSKSRLMGEQRHFTYYLGPSLELLAIYDADFSFSIGSCSRYVKYVHELQHILRLCNIEKEITL